MKTDFNDLDDLLKKDLHKFLDALKDTLISMLDSGLKDNLKNDLLRSIHALKALSGMYELHQTIEFIVEVEEVIVKIFTLERKTIANDLLNDIFVIRDKIEEQFWAFINTKEKTLPKDILALANDSLEEFTKHYIDYKNSDDQTKISDSSQTSSAQKESKKKIKNQEKPTQKQAPASTPAQVQAPTITPALKTNNTKSDFYVENDVIYFAPLSLHKDDVERYQKLFVENLDNVKKIEIDLGATNKLDITGINFIRSIKKHCKVSGINFIITQQSELVVLETNMLGVEL